MVEASYWRRHLGSLKCRSGRVHPAVVAIRRVVLSIGILRPFHLLVASVSSIVKIGKLELGLVQQGFPYWEILETRILPGRPEAVLRIFQGVVGHQVMLYIVHGDGHCLLEQPIVLELVRIHKRADQTAIGVLVWAIVLFILRRVW